MRKLVDEFFEVLIGQGFGHKGVEPCMECCITIFRKHIGGEGDEVKGGNASLLFHSAH
jgi:hypothetical protein